MYLNEKTEPEKNLEIEYQKIFKLYNNNSNINEINGKKLECEEPCENDENSESQDSLDSNEDIDRRNEENKNEFIYTNNIDNNFEIKFLENDSCFKLSKEVIRNIIDDNYNKIIEKNDGVKAKKRKNDNDNYMKDKNQKNTNEKRKKKKYKK